jgi:hypothetical protein
MRPTPSSIQPKLKEHVMKDSKYFTQNEDGTITVNKLPVAFGVAGFIGGSCAAQVVTAALKNNVYPDGKYDKVKVFIGCMVIGSMVSTYVGRYVERELTEITEETKKNIEEQKNSDGLKSA